MRDPENIASIAACGPDYMGFIFYSKSSRYVGPMFTLDSITSSIKKAGVFVNETPDKVMESCQKYHLDVAQLHGNESPGYCRQVQQAGLTVFKAFAMEESFDFKSVEEYSESCHFFLFDTKGQLPGGTGNKFNWQLLNNYQLEVPFFLSGGIRPEDLNTIKQFHHPRLYGVDINSGFELSPAVKEVSKVRQFIAGIKSKN